MRIFTLLILFCSFVWIPSAQAEFFDDSAEPASESKPVAVQEKESHSKGVGGPIMGTPREYNRGAPLKGAFSDLKRESLSKGYAGDGSDAWIGTAHADCGDGCVPVRVRFKTGSSYIRPAFYKHLNKVARRLPQLVRANDNVIIQIAGHTDSVGSRASNKRLSAKRARSVARYFQQYHGIDYNWMRAYAFGEERAVASNSTAEGRMLNRRVEVKILLADDHSHSASNVDKSYKEERSEEAGNDAGGDDGEFFQ